MNKLKVVEMAIDEVIPYENNPRINDMAGDKVAASIREFGFQNPIIVDRHNVIIAGHTRLKAAKQLGLKTVPVMIAEHMTEEQARAYRLVDNKTGELAEWDLKKLIEEIDKVTDIDLELFGFMPRFDGEEPELAEKEETEPDEKEKVYCPRCGALVALE